MKRILGILLIICILLSSLTGCSAFNKTRILGEWYVEDVQIYQDSFMLSLMMDMIDFEIINFGVFEIKYRVSSSLSSVLPAGLEDSIRYSICGDTLKLDVDESQYADISDEEIPFLEFEISFEGDNLILTNEDFGEFVLSRAE